MKAVKTLLLLLAALLLAACDSREPEEKSGDGRIVTGALIGGYFGDPDLTNPKRPEELPSLNKTWTPATGHGSAWSARYEGFIEAPVTGDVTVTLYCSQSAALQIKDEKLEATPGDEVASVIAMEEGTKYPVTVSYFHTKDTTGTLQVYWEWRGQEKQIIPDTCLSYDEATAERWKWTIEKREEDINYSSFLRPSTMKHVIVYYEEGRFGGWPANNGVWIYGDEIVLMFALGYFLENPLHHSIDEKRGSDRVITRSTDGGLTWTLEGPVQKVASTSSTVNYTHENFAMYVDDNEFFVSYDKGKTWEGPHNLPMFGQEDLTPRTDYIVEDENTCYYFLSAEDNDVQAQLQDRAFAAVTTDGGKTFDFLSWIGEPAHYRAVMPSTVEIYDGHFVTTLRRRYDEYFDESTPHRPNNWIDAYESADGGKTWSFLSKVADTDMGKNNGNPPMLVKLKNGDLVVTYGYRAAPYGIRAKISSDGGKTWSPEIHLRDHAREFDLGYTRSVVRPDGKVVTMFYIATDEHYEQHIEAVIWDPASVEF